MAIELKIGTRGTREEFEDTYTRSFLEDNGVNTCNYKCFKTEQLKNFRSMLKSNIKNFENIIEPTIEEMIDEDKVEELLPLIEHEIKVRSNDGRN